MRTSTRARCAGYRFPAEIIGHAVWLYFRFPLGLRMVEELLAARGIIVSHETVRQWALKFGQHFANQIRRRLPRGGDKWHLNEVVLKIAGVKHWLWRAVDQAGVVLDVLVQRRRDKRAATICFDSLAPGTPSGAMLQSNQQTACASDRMGSVWVCKTIVNLSQGKGAGVSLPSFAPRHRSGAHFTRTTGIPIRRSRPVSNGRRGIRRRRSPRFRCGIAPDGSRARTPSSGTTYSGSIKAASIVDFVCP
jgi:DDE domain